MDPRKDLSDFMDDVAKNSRDFLFYVEKTTNKNVVVFELKPTPKPRKPLNVYWLDYDPETQRKKKEQGKLSIRDELTVLEKTFVYCYKSQESVETPGWYVIRLERFSSKPINVGRSGDGSAVAVTQLGGKHAFLKKVTLHFEEDSPKIKTMTMHGQLVEEDMPVTETVIVNKSIFI